MRLLGLGLAAAALGISACAGGGEEAAPTCPSVIVVGDARQITQFLPGQGRDLTDIVLEASIVDFNGTCETDTNDDVEFVDVELNLTIEARRGPANSDRTGAYEYFVAIVDQGKNIRAREVFASDFEFEDGRTRLAAVEELTQEIPLRPGEAGQDYDIMVGFQLTREQLEYNRNRGAQ